MPLVVQDCPLLAKMSNQADSLVATYARAEDELSRFLSEFPDGRTNEKFVALQAELNRVREIMVRECYSVGYLGTTGAGKSTTFNNVLNLPKEMRPAREGPSSKPTTSGVLKLRSSPGTWKGRLQYLTSEDYLLRRKELLRATGFDPDDQGLGDEDVLSKLPALRSQQATGGLRNGDKDESSAQPVLPKDLAALESLIRTHQQFRTLLGASRPLPNYDLRHKYLNHGDSADPANQLLDFVELGLDTTAIPRELEMIDLPGLASAGTLDSIITRRFLGRLQGALVFFRSSNLENQEITRLLLQLKVLFDGPLNGRVWFVLTAIDGLSAAQICGDEKNESFVDGVKRLLDEFDLPPGRVCFVSNEWSKLSNDEIRKQLSHKLGSEDPIPPGFHKHPALRPAFEQMLDGAGIPWLRRLISEHLAGEVSAEIERSVGANLTRLEQKAVKLRDDERKIRAMDDAAVQNAQDCLTVVRDLRAELSAGRGLFEEQGSKVRSELEERFFQKLCPKEQTLDQMLRERDFDFRRDLFQGHALQLLKALEAQLQATLVGELYGFARGRLAVCRSVPQSSFPNGSVAEQWDEFAEADAEAGSWHGARMPTFLDDQLFTGRESNEILRLDGAGYREMMGDKIRIVSQQSIHAVRFQMIHRTRELESELKQLARSDDVAGMLPSRA